MQGIEFEENNDPSGQNRKAPTNSNPSFMVDLLKKAGVQNPVTANFILLGVAVVFLGLTFYLYVGLFGSKENAGQINAEQMAPSVQN